MICWNCGIETCVATGAVRLSASGVVAAAEERAARESQAGVTGEGGTHS